MKHQQVTVDYVYMLKCSFICLALAALGFIFLRLVQAVFWFPGYLKQRQEEIIKKLEEKVKELEVAERKELSKGDKETFIFDDQEVEVKKDA